MSELKEIGRNIVRLRKALGLTQEEVTYRANVSISCLQAIEYGSQNMKVDTLMRIADSFGIDSQVLGIFSWEDSVILDKIRQTPRLPEQKQKTLQICRNIRMMRKIRGMTQKELARLSNISITCLRDMEYCCSNMTTKKLQCVARGFGLSLTELGTIAMREETLMEMVYDARAKAGIIKPERNYMF